MTETVSGKPRFNLEARGGGSRVRSSGRPRTWKLKAADGTVNILAALGG
jgi:hypothetical protein